MTLHQATFFLLCLSTFAEDCVQLVEENGFRDNTRFYHLGDGRFAYHISYETQRATYFKCVLYERGCRGRAVLRMDGNRFKETRGHNHFPDPNLVGERHFRQNILDEVRQRPFAPFQDLVDQGRIDQRYSRGVRVNMTLARLRSPMQRARMEKYPNIPHTLRELTQILLQDATLAQTLDQSEHLYAGSTTATDGSHHVMFISPRMSGFLATCTIIHGDGTFKSRPQLPESCQVFTIVATKMNCIIPIAWVLMERRTTSAYNAVFNLLKTVCPNLQPFVIMSDWERAQQLAWQAAFPNAELLGCLWHLSNAFVKKAKKLGLMRYRRALPNLLTYVHKACAIALLPKCLFKRGLRVIKEEAFRDDVLIAYLLEPFFGYVNQRWLSNPSRKNWMSLYKKKFRTNNACESHNRVLRQKVGAYRPNIFLFIQALGILENNASLDCDLMVPGKNPRRPRKWQSVWTDFQLKNLTRELENNDFHDRDAQVLNFLTRATELFQGAFDLHVARAVGRRERA